MPTFAKGHSWHRCTRVENLGGGLLEVFAKIGVGVTYLEFYCIFIKKFFENLPGEVLFYTPIPPQTPRMCIYDFLGKNWRGNYLIYQQVEIRITEIFFFTKWATFFPLRRVELSSMSSISRLAVCNI